MEKHYCDFCNQELMWHQSTYTTVVRATLKGKPFDVGIMASSGMSAANEDICDECGKEAIANAIKLIKQG